MLALCFLEMMRQELLATSENEGSEMEAKPDDEPGACLTCEEAAAAAREKPAGDSGSAAAVGEGPCFQHGGDETFDGVVLSLQVDRAGLCPERKRPRLHGHAFGSGAQGSAFRKLCKFLRERG